MDPNHIFYACLSTHDDWRAKGQALVDAISRSLQGVISPLGLELKYDCYSDKSEVSARKFGSKAWDRLRSQLLAGELWEVSIFHHSHELWEEARRMHDARIHDGQPSSMVCSIGMSSTPRVPSLAGILELSVQRRPYADLQFPPSVQITVINAFLDLCQELSDQAGFITTGGYSYLHPVSADEAALDYPGYNWTGRHLRQYARGANWGNFLAPVHVQALGGISRVIKEAPCYLMKELPNGGAYLQLTEDVNRYGEEELAKLRQFLQPVMPPKCERKPTQTAVPASEPEPDWRLDPGSFMDWPDIGFSLNFTRNLTDAEQEAIRNVVHAWYTVGVNGGYLGGFLHNITEFNFEEPDLLIMGIDCGSCPPSVLEVLERMLKSACKDHRVGVKRVETRGS